MVQVQNVDLLTPRWAIKVGSKTTESGLAFAAGGAIYPVDHVVQSGAKWLKTWRLRLALHAAEASIFRLGKVGDRASIRDAWYLRKTGDDVGPAGQMFDAWRRLCVRSQIPSEEGLKELLQAMGLSWSDRLNGLADEVDGLTASARSVPQLVVGVLNAVAARTSHAEPLGFWLADLALAKTLGWSAPVPLLSTGMAAPEIRRLHFSTAGADVAPVVLRALISGSIEACRLASALQWREDTLNAVLPRIRTRRAADLVDSLMTEEAVPGFVGQGATTRFAVRRFMERLQEHGAVTELSGRDTFRLYGL